MRVAEPPQSNFDPPKWAFHDGDIGGVTFECLRWENGNMLLPCIKGKAPVFDIEPIAKTGARVAEAPNVDAASPAGCSDLPYSDDQTVIEEGVAYCVQTDTWLAVFRIDDLPDSITSDDPTRIVLKAYVTVWNHDKKQPR